jgi:hypothetical protein
MGEMAETVQYPKYLKVVNPWDIGEDYLKENFFAEYHEDGQFKHLFRTTDKNEFYRMLEEAGYRRTPHGDYVLSEESRVPPA